ncbi:Protein Dok-7 [Papilio machaon]|uniref:Protein Dok-7 n=1 Tax=Papilio machaon TaxID=76193 RepID=A0A194QQM0_PAPMA|nr:Protein Dok-7 [Papilio machaon]
MLVALQLCYSSADCVHLQLYKDLKERQRNGQTKASLSLQQYLGFEAGFTLDKESNTLAILCEDVVPVLAFDTREILIQWRVKWGGEGDNILPPFPPQTICEAPFRAITQAGSRKQAHAFPWPRHNATEGSKVVART